MNLLLACKRASEITKSERFAGILLVEIGLESQKYAYAFSVNGFVKKPEFDAIVLLDGTCVETLPEKGEVFILGPMEVPDDYKEGKRHV